MALAIDAGQNFLGRPVVRRDVLYIGAEDTAARFKSRLERMCAIGSAKFMDRDQLKRFAKLVKIAAGDGPVDVELVVRSLWERAGRPTVLIIDTQGAVRDDARHRARARR